MVEDIDAVLSPDGIDECWQNGFDIDGIRKTSAVVQESGQVYGDRRYGATAKNCCPKTAEGRDANDGCAVARRPRITGPWHFGYERPVCSICHSSLNQRMCGCGTRVDNTYRGAVRRYELREFRF